MHLQALAKTLWGYTFWRCSDLITTHLHSVRIQSCCWIGVSYELGVSYFKHQDKHSQTLHSHMFKYVVARNFTSSFPNWSILHVHNCAKVSRYECVLPPLTQMASALWSNRDTNRFMAGSVEGNMKCTMKLLTNIRTASPKTCKQ